MHETEHHDKHSRQESTDWNATDVLAAFRTILANERTVLSYMRTALTFFVAGVTFVHFFDSLIIEIVGWVFIPLGLVTIVLGVYRYNREKRNIRRINDRNPRSPHI